MTKIAHIHLTPKQTESIMRLSDKTGLPVEEVVKRAFQLYTVAIDEQKDGNQIGVVQGKVVKKILSGISTNDIEVVDVEPQNTNDLIEQLIREEEEHLDKELFQSLLAEDEEELALEKPKIPPTKTKMPGPLLRDPHPNTIGNMFRLLFGKKLTTYQGFDERGRRIEGEPLDPRLKDTHWGKRK